MYSVCSTPVCALRASGSELSTPCCCRPGVLESPVPSRVTSSRDGGVTSRRGAAAARPGRDGWVAYLAGAHTSARTCRQNKGSCRRRRREQHEPHNRGVHHFDQSVYGVPTSHFSSHFQSISSQVQSEGKSVLIRKILGKCHKILRNGVKTVKCHTCMSSTVNFLPFSHFLYHLQSLPL